MTFGLPQPRMAGSKFFPAVKPVVHRELGVVEKAIEAAKGARPNALIVKRVSEVLAKSAPRQYDTAARAAAFNIIRDVCAERGIPIEVMLGQSRARHITAARQEAMWRVWRTGMSYCAVAHLFGKDHSTIIHAVQKCEAAARNSAGVSGDNPVSLVALQQTAPTIRVVNE